MKSFTSFKSFAILATLTLFLASCSNERYGNIQRGSVKSKETAKVEKSIPTTVQAAEEAVVVEPILTEAPSSSEVFSSFNAIKAVKTVEATTVKERISKKIISKMFSQVVATAVEPKESAKIETTSNHTSTNNHEVDKVLLILLAILIPPVAVGLVSDWSDTTAIIVNLILTILCWIPGIIHAFIYIKKNN